MLMMLSARRFSASAYYDCVSIGHPGRRLRREVLNPEALCSITYLVRGRSSRVDEAKVLTNSAGYKNCIAECRLNIHSLRTR